MRLAGPTPQAWAQSLGIVRAGEVNIFKGRASDELLSSFCRVSLEGAEGGRRRLSQSQEESKLVSVSWCHVRERSRLLIY
jgi:hypothetical protein